jgi:diaminohydroxyphosphoribosylaminopyrimidine deaminase/5-amino-6-(5-phosphoribosylamino)uracil reductase
MKLAVWKKPMMTPETDNAWMSRAIALAEKGRLTTTPNPNVGCVLVKDNQLVGEGYHIKAGTAHAEVHALAQAGAAAKGATAYVTLEPCSHYGRTPPCAEALIKAGVARVVCAGLDPNPLVAGRGIEMLKQAGIEVTMDVLAEQAASLNPGFLKRMRTGLPHVTVKMAASLDGATAMNSGESQWITGPQAREDVQQGRASSCAIVTGIGTVLADDPSLNVRLADCTRQPARIILDTHARTPVAAKIGKIPGETYVIHSDQAASERIAALNKAGFHCVTLPVSEGHIDLRAFLTWAGQQPFNQLWIEAGATLAGALLTQGLVDEVVLYQALIMMGSQTRPLLNTEFTQLKDAIAFDCIEVDMVGADTRWRLKPRMSGATE